MAHQTGKNIRVSYKVEVSTGVAVTGTGSQQFRTNGGSGLQFSRATITPNEVRSDGKMTMGRLGSISVSGSLPADLSLGTFDTLLEGGVRGTWSTAITITQSTITTITANASGFVSTGIGSWIGTDLKVGDVFRMSGTTSTVNDNKNLRVAALTTGTLTTVETLVVNTTTNTAFTLTRGKKLVMPSTPVRRSYTFDEYLADVDLSKVSVGCRVASFKVTGQPDGMAIIEFGVVGMGQTAGNNGNSPSLTSPTLTSTTPLTWLDASIKLGSADRTNLTGFEFTFDNGAQGLPVIGSSTSPDVFENNASLSGTVSGTVQDFTDFSAFVAETELEFHALLVEPEAEPKDYISFFIPRVKLTSYDTPQGGDGAMIASMGFMTGTKGTATGYDDTMISIVTSAA